ncbi:ADP-ribose pyrophosphatase YjhB (NUDIX family) [Spirosoma oryzae]|uniref:ADP-ribose pyrophosphatase YjhB (NUDIX family) n=1 Tax=Spirosoma oryzae TaxID=1469603 RepID=A0A2T0SUI3_9BACT|nr:NUDIX domain-containing protein [Spirosoma oryzae]PRY37076.1 ADP-ribose pyrophosphatase YjhB (NUDIX family) [Spirosoma oryzae]
MTQVLDKPRQEVITLYGNRLRLRVCGLYRQDDQLLMVRHRGIGPTNTFWCPPGGGAQFGEAAPDALVREFSEETGLDIRVGELLFVNEFMLPPLHALELFFRVDAQGGQLLAGTDPEMSPDGQIIEEVRLMSFDEIKSYPPHEVHAMFRYCQSLDDVFALRGYLPR